MALTTNLVSCWEMESGAITTDAHGSNTLTNNNTVTSAAGKVGSGADFESSSSQYLSMSSNASVQFADDDMTIAAWVKPESNPGGGAQMFIVGKDVAASREYGLSLRDAGGGAIWARFDMYNGFISVENVTDIGTGAWHFIMAGHDKTNDIIWVSVDGGTRTTTATSGTAFSGTTAEFRIGAREYSGFENYFDGMIDQVGLWNRVVDTTDEASLYNSGNGLSYAAMSGGAATAVPVFMNQYRQRRA